MATRVSLGIELLEHFKLFGGLLWVEAGDPGNVSSGPLYRCGEAKRNWIENRQKDDWELRCGLLCGLNTYGSHRNDDINVQTHKLRGKAGHTVVLPSSKSKLCYEILPSM